MGTAEPLKKRADRRLEDEKTERKKSAASQGNSGEGMQPKRAEICGVAFCLLAVAVVIAFATEFYLNERARSLLVLFTTATFPSVERNEVQQLCDAMGGQIDHQSSSDLRIRMYWSFSYKNPEYLDISFDEAGHVRGISLVDIDRSWEEPSIRTHLIQETRVSTLLVAFDCAFCFIAMAFLWWSIMFLLGRAYWPLLSDRRALSAGILAVVGMIEISLMAISRVPLVAGLLLFG